MTSTYDLEPVIDRIGVVSHALTGDGQTISEPTDGLDPEALRAHLLADDSVREALVVRTCERLELYAMGTGVERPLRAVEIEGGDGADQPPPVRTGREAVAHLFRVACGLESSVLGEDEILGQLRSSYRAASNAGCLGGPLDTTVLKALRVGERVRSETTINEGRISLGSVTVDHILERSGQLSSLDILVLGAGEVAELVITALAHHSGQPPAVTVANRTRERAETLAAAIDGDGASLTAIVPQISAFDVIVSATAAPEPIIEPAMFDGSSCTVFDLANPPDVDPGVSHLESVELVTLDDILSSRIEGMDRRRRAIPAVESIIAEELEHLEWQLRAERVDTLLGEIYSRAHQKRQRELERAVSRLDGADQALTPEQAAVIRDFSETLVNKLLHPKTAALKQAAANDDRATVDAWFQLLESRESSASDCPATDCQERDNQQSSPVEQSAVTESSE